MCGVLNMTTRFKNMYERAKENLISPSMIYVYENVIYAMENEGVKLTDDEIEKVCDFIDSCLGSSDYISVYNLARYFMIQLDEHQTVEDIYKSSISDFVNDAIEFYA